jgi:hypothetical protein
MEGFGGGPHLDSVVAVPRLKCGTRYSLLFAGRTSREMKRIRLHDSNASSSVGSVRNDSAHWAFTVERVLPFVGDRP